MLSLRSAQWLRLRCFGILMCVLLLVGVGCSRSDPIDPVEDFGNVSVSWDQGFQPSSTPIDMQGLEGDLGKPNRGVPHVLYVGQPYRRVIDKDRFGKTLLVLTPLQTGHTHDRDWVLLRAAYDNGDEFELRVYQNSWGEVGNRNDFYLKSLLGDGVKENPASAKAILMGINNLDKTIGHLSEWNFNPAARKTFVSYIASRPKPLAIGSVPLKSPTYYKDQHIVVSGVLCSLDKQAVAVYVEERTGTGLSARPCLYVGDTAYIRGFGTVELLEIWAESDPSPGILGRPEGKFALKITWDNEQAKSVP